jgi:hypothetical protein
MLIDCIPSACRSPLVSDHKESISSASSCEHRHKSCNLFPCLRLDAHRHDLSLGDDAPNIVNAVIEIPRWAAHAPLPCSNLQPSHAHQSV